MTAQVRGFTDVVVSPDFLATDAGMEILAAGGNAADAAVAADAVLGVVAPETCGIGGDLFALVHAPGMVSPAALNASGRAGSGADAANLWDGGYRRIPASHPQTVTVPGCVDGWIALLSSYGSLGLAQVLEPAIRLAEEGFPAPAELADSLARRRPELSGQPSGLALYPNGEPPSAGTHLVRADLAQTLRAVASGGRAAFYSGEPGAEISRALNGNITNEDLARSQADWVQPLGLSVFGLSGWTIPPNSQGYLTLAAARIFELLESPKQPDHPEFWHLLIESYRAAAFDRDDVVADAEHMRVPAEELVGEARTVGRAATVRRDSAGVFHPQRPLPGGTAYLCVLDRAGMGLSFIQSNFMGFGSGIGAGRAGFFLHNRGAGFDLRPGHPNRLAPGKRPLHTLSPTLWTEGDRLACLLGTRGGDYQPQLLLQAAAHLFFCGMDPATVQSRPRWVLDDFGPDTSSRPLIESTTPSPVVDGLRARGHQVGVAGPAEASWGPVSIITVDAGGLRTAAADPRVDSASAAVRE